MSLIDAKMQVNIKFVYSLNRSFYIFLFVYISGCLGLQNPVDLTWTGACFLPGILLSQRRDEVSWSNLNVTV